MDRINDLSDEIICHILSFLAFKESALTSVLSNRWRNLFAFRPDLHLDDQELGGGQGFVDFVDRVLAVTGSFLIRKISIKCQTSIDTGHVTRWMSDVLKHGVFNLDIDIINPEDAILVPLEIFTCKTLVHLKLTEGFEALIPDYVSLPSLKTLFLGSIWFYNSHYCVLEKLLSACPVLEELTILGGRWQITNCCRTVSSLTLKRLTLKTDDHIDYWDMALNTPSLTYLEYSDLVPKVFPSVNLESLVEAKLDLDLCAGNPTNLIEGLTNVEVLELSSGSTWETFWRFREAIPVFSNLLRLSITIDCRFFRWEFLPILLKKSPNLHTLVFKGPLYADICEREYGLSCPVKVLKITEYGGKVGVLEQMKHFLAKLPCLELVKVRACGINEKEKSRITKDLLKVPRSSKCNIQIKFCEKLSNV